MIYVLGMVIWRGSYNLLSNVIIEGTNFYYIKNQFMIFEIDNSYVSFLICVIYTHRETNDILCYNFTYQQKYSNTSFYDS